MMEDHPLKCPICKNSLKKLDDNLKCQQCDKVYNIIDNIPDLSVGELGSEEHDMVKFFNETSGSYESTRYHAQLYQLYAGLPVFSDRMVIATNQQIKKEIKSMLSVQEGLVLDVACGTGMFGRSIALQNLSDLQLYSVDLSLEMLKIAKKYSDDKNILKNSFIRANVEQLPFADGYFDGVCCCGALQLFPDLDIALGEINRVLKSGSKLVGMTYLTRKNETLKFTIQDFDKNRASNEQTGEIIPINEGKCASEIKHSNPAPNTNKAQNTNKSKSIHFFEIDELGELFHRTGYDNFKYITHGLMIVFETQKIS